MSTQTMKERLVQLADVAADDAEPFVYLEVNRALRDAADAIAALQRENAALKSLLLKCSAELRHCRVYVSTRERIHPNGLELYDELRTEIAHALAPSQPPPTEGAREPSRYRAVLGDSVKSRLRIECEAILTRAGYRADGHRKTPAPVYVEALATEMEEWIVDFVRNKPGWFTQEADTARTFHEGACGDLR